jgi:hypothetical protein
LIGEEIPTGSVMHWPPENLRQARMNTGQSEPDTLDYVYGMVMTATLQHSEDDVLRVVGASFGAASVEAMLSILRPMSRLFGPIRKGESILEYEMPVDLKPDAVLPRDPMFKPVRRDLQEQLEEWIHTSVDAGILIRRGKVYAGIGYRYEAR